MSCRAVRKQTFDTKQQADNKALWLTTNETTLNLLCSGHVIKYIWYRQESRQLEYGRDELGDPLSGSDHINHKGKA